MKHAVALVLSHVLTAITFTTASIVNSGLYKCVDLGDRWRRCSLRFRYARRNGTGLTELLMARALS